MAGSRKHYFFDMDGTLTASRSEITPSMKEALVKLAKKADVVIVSGAARAQMKKQLPFLPHKAFYCLAESGNDATYGYVKLWRNLLGPDEVYRIKRHIQEIGKYAKPYEATELLEDRGGQLSFSMVGHDAPREIKAAYDPKGFNRLGILRRHPFKEKDLQVRVGGTTCFDYSRAGWGKAGNIKMLLKTKGWAPEDCYYVGDQLYEGGNDHDVSREFHTMAMVGVAGPADTEQFINQQLKQI